jgi:hypothetical protein
LASISTHFFTTSAGFCENVAIGRFPDLGGGCRKTNARLRAGRLASDLGGNFVAVNHPVRI